MEQVQAVIGGRTFTLARRDVERSVARELPEPIGEHFVVVAGRRFPPKQVIGRVTGLDRADFNTHQARRVLSRLGFTVGRRSSATAHGARLGAGPHGGAEAEALRPFRGQWVAQRGLDVLVAAPRPQDVVAWLERHNEEAEAMFRVPRDERDATGGAPG